MSHVFSNITHKMKYYHLKKGTYLSSLLPPTLWYVNILFRLIPTKTCLPKQCLLIRTLGFQFRPLVLKLHSCVLHTGFSLKILITFLNPTLFRWVFDRFLDFTCSANNSNIFFIRPINRVRHLYK
jgi:hypothetical protein